MRDTIDMTREAGGFDATPEFLKRFEALVRADEREACAKVCDDAFSGSHTGRVVCENLAYAIRARSKA